jgi:hypothetical protein
MQNLNIPVLEEIYLFICLFSLFGMVFSSSLFLILNCLLGLNSQFGFQCISINIASIKCTNK